MMTWLYANLINIVLTAGIVLFVGFLIRGMVRDQKAGQSPCGGCSGCGACGGCSACGGCRPADPALKKRKGNIVSKKSI